jgi:hypothetical protein
MAQYHYLCVFVSHLILLFSVQSLSYQRKAGDYFFPGLLVYTVMPFSSGTPEHHFENAGLDQLGGGGPAVEWSELVDITDTEESQFDLIYLWVEPG